MIIVAHILGFALIVIASTFDVMHFSLDAQKIKYFIELPSILDILAPTIFMLELFMVGAFMEMHGKPY